MRKFIFYPLFLLLAFQLTVSCESKSSTLAQTSSQNDESEVGKVIQAHLAAWNNHDSKKLAELYASDGDLHTSWNEVGKSRKEIEAIYASEQAKRMKDAHLDSTVKSIRMVKPDIAFVDMESTITGNQDKGQTQSSRLHHHVVFVLVKRDGKWQILIGRPF